VHGGVLAEPSAALLRQFFAERRAQRRAERGLLAEPPAAVAAGPSFTAAAAIDTEAAAPIPAGDAVELSADTPLLPPHGAPDLYPLS